MEIGGTGYAFNINCGDVLMMDSDGLWHGSRDYLGDENPGVSGPNDRVIGIFILHKSYLRFKGVPKEELERETFFSRTIPEGEEIRERAAKKRKKDKRKRYKANKKKREEEKL